MAKAKSETAVEAAKPVAVVGKPIMLPKLDLRMIRIRLIGDAPRFGGALIKYSRISLNES